MINPPPDDSVSVDGDHFRQWFLSIFQDLGPLVNTNTFTNNVTQFDNAVVMNHVHSMVFYPILNVQGLSAAMDFRSFAGQVVEAVMWIPDAMPVIWSTDGMIMSGYDGTKYIFRNSGVEKFGVDMTTGVVRVQPGTTTAPAGASSWFTMNIGGTDYRIERRLP